MRMVSTISEIINAVHTDAFLDTGHSNRSRGRSGGLVGFSNGRGNAHRDPRAPARPREYRGDHTKSADRNVSPPSPSVCCGQSLQNASDQRALEQTIFQLRSSIDSTTAAQRIDLLMQRAAAPFVSKSLNGMVTECDLVAEVMQGRSIVGYLYDPVAGDFIVDGGRGRISNGALRAFAVTPGQEVTYTAVPPGSGSRIAFSRVLPPRRRPRSR